MIRPPLERNRTPEDALLAGIGNPWRRELLRFCAAPRSWRDIKREYLLVDVEQLKPTLKNLVGVGWLLHERERYQINPAALEQVVALVEALFESELKPGDIDDGQLDAAVAALRRSSCRTTLKALDQEQSTLELVERTGLTRKQVYRAGQLWTRLGVCRETPDRSFLNGNRYRRTGSSLPALGGYVDLLQASMKGIST